MNGEGEIVEMPAEDDFSDSIPNPYIGKVRRRVTMNTDMNNENGKVVTDEMIADWESALERDEWPNGWVNVGEIVEGKLPKAEGKGTSFTTEPSPMRSA